MVNNIKAIVAGVDGYTQSYRYVLRDAIDCDVQHKLEYGEAAVGVYEISEDKKRLFNLTECTLHIVIEFYYKPKIGQSHSAELNRILAELQKAMLEDYGQGGHALNTEETGNQIDIDGIYAKIINGSINFDVMYRHAMFDPTQQIN